MRSVFSWQIGLMIFLFGASASNAADTDVQIINSTYEAWEEAANEKDLEKWSSFVADDPYFLPPDAPALTSKKEVLDYIQNSFSDPEFSLECEQLKVDISESGDMAWSHGLCNATFTGPDRNTGKVTSRWIKVWVKQLDGSWQGRVNAWIFQE